MTPQLVPWGLVETDRALIPMIRRMEDVGIPGDAEYFRDLVVLLDDKLAEVDQEIRDAGGPDNPGSSDQVADWLFRRQHIRSKKRTATGKDSTQDKFLEAALKSAYTRPEQRQAITLILDRREIDKVRGTYAVPMPEYLARDGRLHAQILYTRTDTGRLAAKNPNVLAFPKHSDLGILVRHGFRPTRPGYVLAEWDLAQIEMKMMAIDARDERMIAQMLSGVDFHLLTASEVIYKKPKELITKHERFTAKAVNFGILMGMTGKGLSEDLAKKGVFKSQDECQAFIDEWMRGYPQCASYIQAKHAEARRFGYVANWRGRRRYLPAIHSPNDDVMLEACRKAQATPIQGGAQEITKLWMVEAYERICAMREQGADVELLLQVHDAMLFELPETLYSEVDGIMRESLAAIPPFAVPLSCEGAKGLTWGEL